MMINWNSPALLYGLLTVFFLLMYFVLFILYKILGKHLDLKSPLFLAAAAYLLRLMELEKVSADVFLGGYAFIFIVPAALLVLIAVGELLVTLIYRLFHLDKKLEEQSGNPNVFSEQEFVSRPFLYNRKWDQHGK